MRRVFATWALLALSSLSLGQDGSYDRKFDEAVLRKHNIGAGGDALLEFFRARTLSKDQVRQLSDVIEQLGDNNYRLRNQAAAKLLKHGHAVKPLLISVLENDPENLELARRAELCLRRIEDNDEIMLARSAARLLSVHKPAGAVETLINYLPFATDVYVIQAIRESLAVLVDPEQPPPVLVDALTDKAAIKRGTAGETLIQAGVAPLPENVFDLLEDANPQVRLRVALALVENNDKQAVPVLIDLLPKLPAADVWQVEDTLLQIAADGGPKVYLGTAAKADKVRKAWQEWWQKNEANIDLDDILTSPPLLGYTLITQNDARGTNGRLVEMARDHKTLWEISGLRYPVDAEVVGSDRVLIAEYLNSQVTERDFKGNILWRKQVSMPIRCQRLRNGKTFIGTRQQLLMVDKNGKSEQLYQKAGTSIVAAERLRDGRMVIVNSGGILEILDAAGKVQKSFPVGRLSATGANVDVLPGDRFLVPVYSNNMVAEYNADGQMVWKATVPNPTSVTRLPNGNTLVVSQAQRRIVEVTRDGDQVWQTATDGRPWRARRR